MPGGFNNGFDAGFGPVVSSGNFLAALIYYMGLNNSKIHKENLAMNSIIFNSTTPTGYFDPGVKNQGVVIHSIQMDVPLDEVGTTDPTITFSGSWTGAYTFHSTITPELRFKHNEPISISTSLPSAEYSITVNYIRYDSDDMYAQEGTRNGMDFIPLSTWESSKVEPTGII